MKKKVYVDPLWKLHPIYRKELIPYPPDGYEFIVGEGKAGSISEQISRMSIAFSLMSKAYAIAPLNLIKSYLEGLLKEIPEDIDLIFSLPHLIFKKRPWIVEMDKVWDPTGPNIWYFKRFKRLIEHSFASEYCKKILCFSEFSKQTILSTLDCSQFEQKLEVLPRAFHKKTFVKSYNDNKIRLLFMGTASARGTFEIRGGKEVLEAFTILNQRYKNLESVIRSDIPNNIKRKYQKVLAQPNVTVIEELLPFEQLEQVYQSADIFLFPGHYDCWGIIVEAMSYELPVIATDVYGTSEWVEDGNNGLLIQKSERVPYFQRNIPLPNTSSRFQRTLKVTDAKMVDDLVEKASMLIEDRSLRRRMGEAGRWEVDHGSLSIENRNEVLKRVFDEATS